MSLPADKQKKLIDDAENAAVQDSSVSSALVLPLVDLARWLERKREMDLATFREIANGPGDAGRLRWLARRALGRERGEKR